MNLKFKSLFLLVLVICATRLHAQIPVPQVSGKEKRADTYFVEQQYEKAITAYKLLIQENYTNRQASARLNLKLASLYYETRRYADAEPYYEVIMPNVQAFNAKQAAAFLTTLVQLKRTQRATEVARLFLKNYNLSKSIAIHNFSEGLPYLTGDVPDTAAYALSKAPFNEEGSTFWTTRLDHGILYVHIVDDDKAMVKGAQLFYFDGMGSTPYIKIPHTMQQGPAAFADNGNTMIYTDNVYGNGIVREMKEEKLITNPLRLVELKYDAKNNKWEAPKGMFTDKKGASMCHPALSEDGNQLYFASNMEGTKGGMDIYMSRKTNKGWSTPVNLGSVINTEGEELYPNIFDKHLTFSSNGLDGFGGFDVYSVQLGEDGFPIAKTLEHIPYPINTPHNDYALMHNDKYSGYFSSDRPDGNYLDAVYEWVDATHLRQLEKKEREKKEQKNKAATDALAAKTNAAAKGLVTGTVVADATVFFDYNRSTLKRDGEKFLDLFMEKLGESRPNLMVLGYADITGSSAYNLKLSKLRAQEVKNYLVSSGYPASLIEIVGRGQLELSPGEEIKASSLIDRLAPARKAEIKTLD